MTKKRSGIIMSQSETPKMQATFVWQETPYPNREDSIVPHVSPILGGPIRLYCPRCTPILGGPTQNSGPKNTFESFIIQVVKKDIIAQTRRALPWLRLDEDVLWVPVISPFHGRSSPEIELCDRAWPGRDATLATLMLLFSSLNPLA